MRRAVPALALAVVALGAFAASASATFEATMVPRKGSERDSGPTFIVEAGGGRRTRIRNLELEAGACGSLYAPLVDAGHEKAGFASGNGAAIFSLSAQHLNLRIELKLTPRGEELQGSGMIKATVGECHERVPIEAVSLKIRGGGRHAT
jgi:hypothetical protein